MSSVIVTANLGHFKAYRLVRTPNRGAALDFIDELNFLDAHGRYSDKVSDSAGQFPVSRTAGPAVQAATGENLTAEIEVERRLVKAVGQRIEATLRREKPLRWHLAAPAEICPAILDCVAPELRESLVRTVHADLTKIPAGQVLKHFE